jgi:hypothetical protein
VNWPVIRYRLQADHPLHTSTYTVTASTAQLDIALVDETYGTVGGAPDRSVGGLCRVEIGAPTPMWELY